MLSLKSISTLNDLKITAVSSVIMIVIPQEVHVLLAYNKRKALCPFYFFNYRILVEAAHVRKILLVKLVLFQKDTVVSVHKDSEERIVTKVFCSLFIK